MPLSDNGWRVIPPAAQSSRRVVYPKGTDIPFIVRKGTTGLWQIFLDFFHTEVEPLTEAGWDGGYSYRTTRGSTTAWSCHSSATAGDVNASQHPRGQRGTFTPAQVRKIRAFLNTTAGRAFKWGGDFTTVPDEMHFQLRNPATVRAVQLALRVKPKPAPAPQPAPAPPKEEADDMVLYVSADDPKKNAYGPIGNYRRLFSGAEVATLRAQGIKVAFLTVPASDPVLKLPIL